MKNPRCIKIAALLLALSFVEPRLAFADAKDDAAQAAKDIDAAYKEAQENIPNGTVKPNEDKLDEAARKNDDTPDNDPNKPNTEKAEKDARDHADNVSKPFKDNGDKRGDKYREALKKRREACKKLKKALAELRQQLGKRRQSMAADASDLEQAIRDAEKARKEQEKTPERPTVSMAVPQGTPTLATLVASGKIKVDSVGTGETIGHVADLKIQNLTDQPLTCAIAPTILESGAGKNQHYACPSGQTVALNPNQTKTVPMNGVCLNRNKPPVGKGISGDLVINEANPTAPQNPNSHLSPADAVKLLRICTSKYDAADKLQKDGALKNLPYKDKQKQKDIVVQWSTWCDPRISQITGAPPATKDDLKKVVYKQVEEKGPLSPETKKKVDQGIDTIFEKVELTTAKAKDLEKPDLFAQVELTGTPGKGETPPGAGTGEEQPPLFAQQQPQNISQTRAKMPSPTPKPKPGGGKPAPPPKGGTTKEKPAPSPTSTPTPTPTPTPALYPTTADVKTFEEKQNEQIQKAKEELDKAGTDKEKQKRANAKLNALEKICFEAKWAGTHATDDKKNAADGYDDANLILKRIDEVPDARDRLKKAGLSDKAIDEMLNNLNDIAQDSATGLPGDRQIGLEAGKALRANGYDADSDGGKKLDRAIIDLKELYMAEGKYNKNAK